MTKLTLLLLATLVSSNSIADVIKDPTMPLFNLNGPGLNAATQDKEEKKAISLNLQSVIVRKGRKIAVINDQLVMVGQQIEGYKVTGILAYGAQLRADADGEKLSLSLQKANVKLSNE